MRRIPDTRSELDELQAWFGKAIARPLPDEYPANPLAVSAPELHAEADARLRGNGGLGGFGRLGIYNQQYWFRLISIMQSEYTCAIHIMGLRVFNDYAVRYLEAFPPSSPFLAQLDEAFPAFLEREYQGECRAEALQAIAYERALSNAFDAPEGQTLAEAGTAAPSELLSARMRLAPHLTPVRADWDFAAFRALCLPDTDLEAEFPLQREAETTYLAIYRDADLEIMREPLTRVSLAVLEAFLAPATLAEAFEKLEEKLGPEDQTELMGGISGWFREWVARGWLCRDEKAD